MPIADYIIWGSGLPQAYDKVSKGGADWKANTSSLHSTMVDSGPGRIVRSLMRSSLQGRFDEFGVERGEYMSEAVDSGSATMVFSRGLDELAISY